MQQTTFTVSLRSVPGTARTTEFCRLLHDISRWQWGAQSLRYVNALNSFISKLLLLLILLLFFYFILMPSVVKVPEG